MTPNRKSEGLNGRFELLAGPMGATKTATGLILARQLEQSGETVVAFKSSRDPRPRIGHITSGTGIERRAVIVDSLLDAEEAVENDDSEEYRDLSFEDTTTALIDEAMFYGHHKEELVDEAAQETADAVSKWLKLGKMVIVTSLDNAGNGKMFPVYKSLMELKPDLELLTAPCANCGSMEGRHTCIYENKDKDARPFDRETLPFYVPDDGTLGYRALCRVCFDDEGSREDLVEFTDALRDKLVS